MINRLKRYGILILLIYSNMTYSLVPIDTVILGDFTDQYSEEYFDPLEIIFHQTLQSGNDNEIKTIEQYLTLYKSGEGLNQYCSKAQFINDPNVLNPQIKRMMMSTVQYFSIELSVRAISQLAKRMNLEKEQYNNLVENLVTNFCSKNLTLISHRELKNNFQVKYTQDNLFALPSFDFSSFPKNLINDLNSSKINERLLDQSIHLFKSSCSWSGNVDRVGMLAPLLKNPVVMSYVISQLSGKNTVYNKRKNIIESVDDEKSVKIGCDNLICRRLAKDQFDENLFKHFGRLDLSISYHNMYCQHFRDVRDDYRDQGKVVLSWLKDRSLDEENLLIGHFIALLTKVADPMILIDKFSELPNIAKQNITETWDRWSQMALNNFSQGLLFEESLSIDRVPRQYYFSDKSGLQVEFDVNLGELDRSYWRRGKVALDFNVKLPESFLYWAKESYLKGDPLISNQKEIINKSFKNYLKPQIDRAKARLVISPWGEGIEDLVIDEILQQLISFEQFPFDRTNNRLVNIPISFHYGPFALKYLRYRFRANKNLSQLIIE